MRDDSACSFFQSYLLSALESSEFDTYRFRYMQFASRREQLACLFISCECYDVVAVAIGN